MVNSDKVPNQNNHEKSARTAGKHYLNQDEDDEMEIQGYTFDKVKAYTCYTLYVLTVGLLRLFFHWYPQLHLKATHKSSDLKNAEKILVIDNYKKFKSYFVKNLEILKKNNDCNSKSFLTFACSDGTQKKVMEARVLRCKKLTYLWDKDAGVFKKLAGLDRGLMKSELRNIKGLTKAQQMLKRIIYGYNDINVPVQTVLTILALEALTPFYIFQFFSLAIWLFELYLYYAFAIIIMSTVGLTTSVIQTRKNQKNLKGTINIKDKIQVSRGNNKYEEIPTAELVPGDVIVIPSSGCEVQCDAILLNGHCIVNESMLTGESVPITKTPLPNVFKPFDIKEDANHTLFCGTRIIQTRSKGDDKVLALVIRTGYLTTKGELVRSILYPPPADFKFETDSYKFIAMLSVIAIGSMIYTIVSKTQRNINALDILIKAVDVITIAVPPALPAAMTVGKLYAVYRLKKNQIFCINSRVINVSGSVDCICFDKTGTLTEDELDLWGIVPVINNEIDKPLSKVKTLPETSTLFRGMATCHSLSIINGNLGGDPLDMKMFEATEWTMEDSIQSGGGHHIVVKATDQKEGIEIAIVKQFQFASALQRMSVIVEASDASQYEVYCKGAPEMIVNFCRSSTIPPDLVSKLSEFTGQGYRVIAIAHKQLEKMSNSDIENLNREQAECDLNFIGLIVLENRIKPQTNGVICTLKNAKMKVVMITGDNIQTAVHIAKESSMVDADESIIEVIASEPTNAEPASLKYEITSYPTIKPSISKKGDIEKSQQRKYCFAITGNSWANVILYFPDLVKRIVAKGTVFARMTGAQKQQLIEEFKNLGYSVGMCGDGANDCGALKAAHVGISLSEAESSVASPFTSKQQNISCVTKVIKEGRAALVTSFGVFKIMVCYSLVELASVIILYNIDANLSSPEFLFIDLALILNFSSVFGLTKAYSTLSTKPPPSSLCAVAPVTSILSFLVIGSGFQAFGNYWIQRYEWFSPFVYTPHTTNFVCYENYAVYCVSMFQYITMCIVFSKGKPYRKALYTNLPYMLSLIITTMICIYLTAFPHQWAANLMEMKIPPMEARVAMLVISLVGFVTCFVVEDIFVDFVLDKLIIQKCINARKARRLKNDMSEEEIDLSSLNRNGFDLKHISENGKNGYVNNGYVGSRIMLDTIC